ncbi:MAG: enoyl-CoA hydratase/isomerase family protein [candidate division Zixibacteria bacterium]|nr:enoyl-CoA hydratase/isomerase family protein [candidate division Zixibacteria bacterium]
MKHYEFIKVTESNRITRLTLARPPLNVLNMAMLSEINGHFETLVGQQDLCALVIDGEGKMFSSGVDVPEHQKGTVEAMIGTFHDTFRLMHRLPMPTVAAVHGGTYGGAMELAICCDIILAADDLKIGVPEIKLGVFPPLAVAQLADIVGAKKAAELIFTGSVLGADEALRIGLINNVYPAAEFRESVDKFLGKFSALSAFSLGHVKRAFRLANQAEFDRALKEAETVYLRDLMAGHDPTEGLTAFMEKRAPAWTDR